MKNLLFSICCSVSVTTTLTAQIKIEQWSRFEIVVNDESKANPFTDINIAAQFIGSDTTYLVQGFYDGNNQYKIRFMPQKIGIWRYITISNKKELNDKKGSFECIKATGNNHGLVRVSDRYHFSYADGTRYYPFGTTAYAWTHMGEGLQAQTLKSLQNGGFNKIRMCVFPKNYDLVKEEPIRYPFEVKETKKQANGEEEKVWDFSKFNPAFFQHLEKQIDALSSLGMEADLILFHPYDKGRWGFDQMPKEANVRYIKYLAARLASFRNIWWSIANEWDYVHAKTLSDWELLSQELVQADPYHHLCSIHGSTAVYYPYWKNYITHVSLQDEAPVQSIVGAATLRQIYQKPIVLDEVGYEGNLKSRWGRYSPEQMVHLVWNGTMAGAYVTHGESYMFKSETDTIFWAKGGSFRGSSWRQIAFLRKIIEEAPQPLSMADISRDYRVASAGDGYYFVYFGKEIQESWLFNLPAKNAENKRLGVGKRFKIEIIDTMEMTISTYPKTFETTSETDYRVYDRNFNSVRLPPKPYIALRITEVR